MQCPECMGRHTLKERIDGRWQVSCLDCFQARGVKISVVGTSRPKRELPIAGAEKAKRGS